MSHSHPGEVQRGFLSLTNRLEYRRKDAELYQTIFRNLHRCKDCKYLTRSMFSLKNHLETHKIREKFSCHESTPETYFCSECMISTNLKAFFIQHIRKSHCLKKGNEESDLVLKTYKCQKCPFLTYSSLVLFKHELNCEVKKSVSCALKYVKIYSCNSCEYTTRVSHSLKSHMYNKHSNDLGVKLHHCDQCEFKTTRPLSLKTHKACKHNCGDVKYFLCSSCGYKTIYSQHLRRHIKVKHTRSEDIKWLECDQCEHKAKTSSAMSKHKRWKHSTVEKKMFKCEHCECISNNQFNVKEHMLRKHTPDEDIAWFECDQCDFKAKVKRGLTLHLAKHSSVN